MECPVCHCMEDSYSLSETSDDYQDGYVYCNNCGKHIATFNMIVIL